MNGRAAEPVLQRFTDDYLERCRALSPQDIVRFLEEYRLVLGAANLRSLPRLGGSEDSFAETDSIDSQIGEGTPLSSERLGV